ncbi:MAG: hypothetical protein AAFP69_06315, partial [Planctomycetota bacterium]
FFQAQRNSPTQPSIESPGDSEGRSYQPETLVWPPVRPIDGGAGAIAPALPPANSDQLLSDFAKKLQPILVGKCAGHGCHGPAGGQQWTLTHYGIGRRLPLAMTRANLKSTLRFIDQLMEKAKTAHGGASVASMSKKTPRSLAALQAFITKMKGNSSQPVAYPDLSTQQRVRPASMTSEIAAPQTEINPVSRASVQRPGFDAAAPRQSLGDGAARNPRALPVTTDPFDPEIFNRLYGGRSAG